MFCRLNVRQKLPEVGGSGDVTGLFGRRYLFLSPIAGLLVRSTWSELFSGVFARRRPGMLNLGIEMSFTLKERSILPFVGAGSGFFALGAAGGFKYCEDREARWTTGRLFLTLTLLINAAV